MAFAYVATAQGKSVPNECNKITRFRPPGAVKNTGQKEREMKSKWFKTTYYIRFADGSRISQNSEVFADSYQSATKQIRKDAATRLKYAESVYYAKPTLKYPAGVSR